MIRNPDAYTVSATACPCCQRPFRRFEQMAALPGRPPIMLEDCTNRACALYMVTLEAGDHARLSPEKIESYARVRERTME
jgi:hypothetical protein